jgi:hypothetical protein
MGGVWGELEKNRVISNNIAEYKLNSFCSRNQAFFLLKILGLEILPICAIYSCGNHAEVPLVGSIRDRLCKPNMVDI